MTSDWGKPAATSSRHVQSAEDGPSIETVAISAAASAPALALTAKEWILVEPALERLDHDSGLYATIAIAYCDDAPQLLDNLVQAMARAQWQEAMRHAHTLKGLSATVGAQALSMACAKVERGLRANSTWPDTADWALVQSSMEHSLQALQAIILSMTQEPAMDEQARTAAPTPVTPELLTGWVTLLSEGDMHAVDAWMSMRPGIALTHPDQAPLIDRAMQQLDFAAARQLGLALRADTALAADCATVATVAGKVG